MLTRLLEDFTDSGTSSARFSHYPKTLSSPGFYGGYTPFSDSYLVSRWSQGTLGRPHESPLSSGDTIPNSENLSMLSLELCSPFLRSQEPFAAFEQKRRRS